MKKIITIIALFCLQTLINAQVGIFTSTPRATLEIKTKNENNPRPNEGLIIPRVQSLNITDIKPKGLLVFLDSENETTETIERGFWYWTGNKWKPFLSMNKMTTNHTIATVNFNDDFNEGSFKSNDDSDTRFLTFKNDENNSLQNHFVNIDADTKELIVKKTGYYDITALFSLYNSNTESSKRDSYEITLLKNNIATTIISASGFKKSENNNDIVLAGALKLTAKDKIKIKVVRYYEGKNTNVNITQETKFASKLSNLTLTYLGNY